MLLSHQNITHNSNQQFHIQIEKFPISILTMKQNNNIDLIFPLF